MQTVTDNKNHSSAWIAQSWLSLIISIFATTVGLVYLPLNLWEKGYMTISILFTVSSTINVSKTSRDLHESRKLTAKVEEARVEKLLADHHPLQ